MEEMKNILEKEEMMIRKQEEDVKEEQSKIKLKVKEKNAELKKLLGEEKKITPGLEEDILFKFERIIKSKSGLGIVSLTKGVCTGCYMILPPQFVNTVRLGERVEFCPYAAASFSIRKTRRGKTSKRPSSRRKGRTKRRKRKRRRIPPKRRKRNLSRELAAQPRGCGGREARPSRTNATRSGRDQRPVRS